MSIQKVNQPAFMPWSGTEGAMDAVGGSAPTLTSDWHDTNGWTEKKCSWEIDSGGAIDVDIIMHISPLGYYELQALADAGTLTTDHYEAVTLVTGHTGSILASVDSDDIDELRRPCRSTRLVIDNDSAAAVTGATVIFEGWS